MKLVKRFKKWLARREIKKRFSKACLPYLDEIEVLEMSSEQSNETSRSIN